MAITKVEQVVYRTSDGIDFDCMEAAEKHERTKEIVDALESSGIYWREDVDPAEVVQFLEERYVLLPRGSADA